MTEQRVCPCGGTEFEVGFVDDVVNGRVRWLAGALEVGLFGNAKRGGRDQRGIEAARCASCSRLELFAGPLL